MHRRRFLQTAASALAAPSAAALSACASRRGVFGPSTVRTGHGRRLARIGLQLYTLRDAARVGLDHTLARIAQMGYREVELLDSMNGNFGHAPSEVRPMLDRHHLRAPSTHITTTALLHDLDKTLDDAAFLGHSYVIVASIGQEADSVDDYKRWADHLNEAGAEARKRDLWIGLHDEPNDFRKDGGSVLYDACIAHTDPAVTRHELDTGNLAAAGGDPLEYLRRFGDRYWLFHIKDHARPPAQGDGILGTGTLDFRKILAGIPRIDETHLFVEQETYPGDPFASAKRDFTYLSTLEF